MESVQSPRPIQDSGHRPRRRGENDEGSDLSSRGETSSGNLSQRSNPSYHYYGESYHQRSPTTHSSNSTRPSSSVGALINGSRGGGEEQKSLSSGSTFTVDSTAHPRSLEHDLQRLEMEVAVLQADQLDDNRNREESRSRADGVQAHSNKNSANGKSNKKRVIVVTVPPGRLGVVLANRHDGKGTVVAEVRPESVLKGKLSPGDTLVAVDGQDVRGMEVRKITSLMKSRDGMERWLTVITTSSAVPRPQSTEGSGNTTQELKPDEISVE